MIKSIKIDMLWTCVIEDIIGTFTKKNCKKTNQQIFTVQRVIKGKGDKLYVKWNVYDNSFNNSVDKKDIALMSKYFPKPESLGEIVKVELDLSNYAAKSESD